jgi:type I pantothenate kinase
VLSPYLDFNRAEWLALRAATPLTLSQEDLDALRGYNEAIEIAEVEAIYLPLSRLINLFVTNSQNLFQVTDRFLEKPDRKVPFVIGVAGSVAVGKSTTSRILQALLSRWPNHPNVSLVTTDGFLLPNKILEERNLMLRKGFPESYDQKKVLNFLAAIKSGAKEVVAPVYSHLRYDIVPGEEVIIKEPDILIFEGLNVLQRGDDASRVFVSDFFDFSVYVHADSRHLESWFTKRFFLLKDTAFQNPESYFHNFSKLTKEEARKFAHEVWRDINLVNLKQNILPTMDRAQLILHKGKDHAVQNVRLRKL